MAIDLTGIGVLVTRPLGQGEGLCEKIRRLGGRAIHFPTMEILPPIHAEVLAGLLARLAQFHMAVFISPNAVKWTFEPPPASGGGHSPIDPRLDLWQGQLQVAAVGLGTANALRQRGIEPDLFPVDQFNSEALLALPGMRQVQGKNIVIFRGEGGREELARTLKDRGARVEYAEVYRRGLPQADVAALLSRWAGGEIQVVTVTSNEGLSNLANMIGSDGKTWLSRTPMVVVSRRGESLARQLGVTTVAVAQKAGDEALIEAVHHLMTAA